MTNRDQAHSVVDEARELPEGEQFTVDDINILGADYTLTFKQPEPGRLTALLGQEHKQRVEIEAPTGHTYQFWFDPSGPTHDAATALRRQLFDYHGTYFGRVD